MKTGWILLFFLGSIVLAGNGLAQDAETEEIIAGDEAYVFPVIEPEVSLSSGYRWVNVKGSERAEEFEYLHDSLVLGGEARIFSFPHRIHLDIDLRSSKDFFGDVSYAYMDSVLFRGISRTLFHNLDNIALIDLDPAISSPGVAMRDRDEIYGLKFGTTNLFFRLKAPDFPFHVYFDGSFVGRNGTQQQVSLLGSGFFNDLLRTSQKRGVEGETRDITLGMNSHLGPLEVDFSHSEKTFRSRGDRVLTDAYQAAFDPLSPDVTRPAGVFPHNLIPDLKGSASTLAVHTSYTGGVVASATFSRVDRRNLDSGAKAEYFIGAGEITWIPMPRLSFFVRYRHKDTDINNPDTVSIADLANPSSVLTFPVRRSLSSNADVVSGTMKYRPLSGLTLRAEYSYEHIGRDNADVWRLPDSTARKMASLSADLRIARGLTLKARYAYKQVDGPAYNSEPDHSDEGRISVSWVPLPRLNTLVSYSVGSERRNDLRFLDEEGNIIEGGPQERKARREKLLGSVTFLPFDKLSVTASYTYLHNKVRQDIAMGAPPVFPLIVDPLVAYKDMAQSYAFDLTYVPKHSVSLGSGVSYTVSRGTFFPGNPDFIEPVSIASFSDLRIRETACYLSGEYKFKNGFVVGARYKYSNLRDVLDNPHDEVRDGTVHVMVVTISKRWK